MTHTKPIPDEVLRVFVRGEDVDNGYYIRASELAQELLALRECVRGILDGGAVFVYHPTRDRKAEVVALLPKPSEAP